jgi:hypothetical protein
LNKKTYKKFIKRVYKQPFLWYNIYRKYGGIIIMEKEYQKIGNVFKFDEKFRTIVGLNEPYETLKNIIWEGTEKIDGTNIRIYWDGHTVTFGGRTDNASIPAELVTRLNELFGGESNAQMFEQMFGEKEVILFGAGYGRKIQKGGGNYIPDGVDFILFDVLVGENYLECANVEDIARAMGIKVVPIVGRGNLLEAVKYVKSHPTSVIAEGRCEMEGIVARPKMEMRDRRGNRLIVKVKWCDMKELV